MWTRLAVLVSLALALGAAGAPQAQAAMAGGERGDEVLAEIIVSKLQRYVFYTVFDDVEVRVADGIVTLTGFATMPFKAEGIARMAGRVEGVREVQNRIEVLPLSSMDDALRHAIASRIYNDPMFWRYAIHVNPPIHVIVKHSRVILTGVVDSQLEWLKAELLAREELGVLGVENRLRIED
jgi:osmotically-inducible protein OsmY